MTKHFLFDYHIHTVLSGHGVGEPTDIVKAAQHKGLSELGFSEHYLLPMGRKIEGYPEGHLIIDRYLQWMEQIKNAYPHLPIKVGVEIDYFPGREKEIEQILSLYHWDYTIGSVHFINDWAVDNIDEIDGFRRMGVNRAYHHYFAILQEAVRAQLFDIIGHADIIKKFGHRYDGEVRKLYEPLVEHMTTAKCAIELNTAGLRKPIGEMYPDIKLLQLCAEANIPLTLGSDAHAPHEVGMDFAQALTLAKAAGYDRLTTFTRRVQQQTELV